MSAKLCAGCDKTISGPYDHCEDCWVTGRDKTPAQAGLRRASSDSAEVVMLTGINLPFGDVLRLVLQIWAASMVFAVPLAVVVALILSA